MTEEELIEMIAAEAEEINANMVERQASPTTFVLAIISMLAGVHEALDNLDNDADLDEFCRNYADEAMAAVLRDRGWTVIRPGTMN